VPEPEAKSAAPDETHIDWIRNFETRLLDAWNSHEAGRVLAMMTDDIEYRDDAWPKTMRGHADVREFLDSTWTAFPDLTIELVEGPYVIHGKPGCAIYWRASGTHTGRLDPPGLAATGRRWKGDGMLVDEYRDGRVCRLRTCFDMLDASRQLGLMPRPGSLAERAIAAAQRASVAVLQAIRRQQSAQQRKHSSRAD
jgi:steroid delta-isomerase-like uncharacterized protein